MEKVVGTFRYGKLLSRPALVVQGLAVGLSIPCLALLCCALVTAVGRGDIASIIGWIVWGLWLIGAVALSAELLADLLNRRLIARCLANRDLYEAVCTAFLNTYPLFWVKVTIEILLPEGAIRRTFRIRDRSFLRELKAGSMRLAYCVSRKAVLVIQ